MQHRPFGLYERFFKRPLDILTAVVALVLLSPIMGAIALLVRIKNGSPVIFAQERPGKGEKIFTLYKFRTMTDKRGDNGSMLPDADRLTPLGWWLRKYSLDELPELWNVVKGDMSIIGPRPLVVEYLSVYTEAEHHRHDVRPGISGLAQVSGRNYLPWDARLALDVEYVNRITLLGDICIVMKTIRQVIKGTDVAPSTEEIEEGDLCEIRNMKKREGQ